MVVIKIGGCNGSGKTSLVNALFEGGGWLSIQSAGKRKPEAYVNDRFKVGRTNVIAYILGSYETTCGGMDTIPDALDRIDIIEKYTLPFEHRLVVFEGLITGKTYGAIGAISDRAEHKGRWLYTFMDTPFEVCVQRVLERRAARGATNAFDPERTMRPTFRSVELTMQRAQREGHPVHMVDHTLSPAEAAKRLLKAAAKLGGW